MADAVDDWAPVGQQDDWKPVGDDFKPQTAAAPEPVPDAFLHRIAAGMMLGGVADASPEELRKRGFEDFDFSSNMAQQFKAGLERFKKGLAEEHDPSVLPLQPGYNIGAGAFQAAISPLTALFQAAGGAAEKLSGGFISNEMAQTALMMADGAPGRVARVKGGAAEVIGTLPATQDFTAAAKFLGTDEARLRDLWQTQGIHPAEAVHDAMQDAFLKNEIVAPRVELKAADVAAHHGVDPEAMDMAYGAGTSLSAARTPPELIPPGEQGMRPSGSLIVKARGALDQLFDIGRDIQMKVAPNATGSNEALAVTKDYGNAMRRNSWGAALKDDELKKQFSPIEREEMARAMEEESLALRRGEPVDPDKGLQTLSPEQRQAVHQLDEAQQLAWLRARDLNIVHGDGIPMHFPRMALGVAKDSEIGTPSSLTQMYGIRKNTPYAKERKYETAEETERALKAKYGDQASIAWDIRAVNTATKTLEDAIAGKSLIKNIQEVGRRTGEPTVVEGGPKPAKGWFTVDHPAFTEVRPKLGEDGAVVDAAGNTVFEHAPIWVRGDFEGPIRAHLWGDTGAFYSGLMAIKGKTMGLIMNSPMIHNMVEYGRAFPAMPMRMMTPVFGDGAVLSPIRMKVYADGFRAKNDPGVMHEAISHGLVPIGKRFFNQDISAMMEEPDLVPGRSWTAQLARAVPDLFDPAAPGVMVGGTGDKVAAAIDKAGDFWHNRLLWDRIADLQMGLYHHFRNDMVGKGLDSDTAAYIAAHFANRYAGALPKEAMSEMATKASNFMFFSRSFTFGNLGVMKDMLTGMPKDVLAQIERDAGFRAGSINEAGMPNSVVDEAVNSAKWIARRKAIATVALDVGLGIAANSIAQSAFNMMRGTSASQEEAGYIRRFQDLMNDAKANPLKLLDPFYLAGIPGKLSATHENEPGKEDRVFVGPAGDGTGIYMRNPIGKIAEEFEGWGSGPLDMLRKKEGTIMRPLMQIYSNDAGFGRPIYDKHAETIGQRMGTIMAMAKHMMASQLPAGQLNAFSDLVTGHGDAKVNLLQAAGPIAGFTFSKGAPGGPNVGRMYDAKSREEFAVSQAMPSIRRKIQDDDLAGARQIMNQLKMDPSYQRWVEKTTNDPRLRLSPRGMKDFYRWAPPEEKAAFDRAR